MKKLLILCVLFIASNTMFANGGSSLNVEPKIVKVLDGYGRKDVKKPCTVTVEQSGTATGLDCNGVFYVQPIISNCTKSSGIDCATAFISANSCAATTLATDIAAYNAQQQNCN